MFRYKTCEKTHIDISSLLFHTVLSKLINLVVVATKPSLPLILVFTATFLWCSLPNQIKEAAKITAGGLGNHYQPTLYSVS